MVLSYPSSTPTAPATSSFSLGVVGAAVLCLAMAPGCGAGREPFVLVDASSAGALIPRSPERQDLLAFRPQPETEPSDNKCPADKDERANAPRPAKPQKTRLHYGLTSAGLPWGELLGPWDARLGEVPITQSVAWQLPRLVSADAKDDSPPHYELRYDLPPGVFGGVWQRIPKGFHLKSHERPPFILLDLQMLRAPGQDPNQHPIDVLRVELKTSPTPRDRYEARSPIPRDGRAGPKPRSRDAERQESEPGDTPRAAFIRIPIGARGAERFSLLLDTDFSAHWRFQNGAPDYRKLRELVVVLEPRGVKRAGVLRVFGVYRVDRDQGEATLAGIQAAQAKEPSCTALGLLQRFQQTLGLGPGEARANVLQPGATGFFDSGVGFPIVPYPSKLVLGLSTEVEYREEPLATDALVLTARDDRFRVQATSEERREMIRPLRTRASNTAVGIEAPWLPLSPRLTGVLDLREIENQFVAEFPSLTETHQTTLGVQTLLRHTFPGYQELAIDLGARRTRVTTPDEDDGAPQRRQEYFLNLSFTPMRNWELFGQVEYKRGDHFRSVFDEKEIAYRAEIRRRWYGVLLVLGGSRSENRFDVAGVERSEDPVFSRTTAVGRLGLDFCDGRLRSLVTAEYVHSRTTDPRNPVQKAIEAQAVTVRCEAEFEVRRMYQGLRSSDLLRSPINLRLGIEPSLAVGSLSDFDRIGAFAELNVFDPGYVRVGLRARRDWYLHMGTHLDTLMFSVALFR